MKRNKNKKQNPWTRNIQTRIIGADEKPQIEEQTGKKIAEQQRRDPELFDDNSETK